MKNSSRIYVAGHRGLVGSALLRRLQADGYSHLITRTHAQLDLEHRGRVWDFFAEQRPEYVFLAAAKVGGIHANSTYPVDFLLRNLKIQNNVIEACAKNEVKGLIFLGSSCVYPKLAPQPLKEEYLLTGPLEPTNEPYAVAKIAGIELCEGFNRQYGTRFLSVMPTNLYGPNDNYDLENSHVLAAFIRKFHLANLASQGNWEAIQRDEALHGPIPSYFRENLEGIALSSNRERAWTAALPSANTNAAESPLFLWGTGSPRREFLHSDDLADACVFLMQQIDSLFSHYAASGGGCSSGISSHLYNIGCGADLTISELAALVGKTIGYAGRVEWDGTKPDGTPRKVLDVSRMTSLGWRPRIPLEQGISSVCREYVESSHNS
jgi:GDP-L-fucose synthase